MDRVAAAVGQPGLHRAAAGDLRGWACWRWAGAVRNGADDWLRRLLDLLGFGQYFLLPVLTVGILLAWHYLTRRPWRVSGRVLYGMVGECVLLAVCLRLLLQLQGRLCMADRGRGP